MSLSSGGSDLHITWTKAPAPLDVTAFRKDFDDLIRKALADDPPRRTGHFNCAHRLRSYTDDLDRLHVYWHPEYAEYPFDDGLAVHLSYAVPPGFIFAKEPAE